MKSLLFSWLKTSLVFLIDKNLKLRAISSRTFTHTAEVYIRKWMKYID
jgi:hypothetical protein